MHQPSRQSDVPRGATDLDHGIVVAGAVSPRRWSFLIGAEEWTHGRNGWVRLPLLLFFVWVLRRHLQDRDYQSIFGGLDLAIHEAGHIVFGPLGEVMGVAGGTILQLAAPLAAAAIFWRQRDRFAIAVALCWLSTNLFDVARYIADARALALPLVSPTSGDPLHDWNFLLARMNVLTHDTAIAGGVRALAVASMLLGLAAGAWLVWRMIRTPRQAAPT